MVQSVVVDDATLDCESWGDPSNPLALCLHGFPDTRATFRHLAPALAAQGYYVVAPAMRGYAPSSVSSRGDYSLARLAHDVVQLHDAFDGDARAVLIGHDWGAVATYGAILGAPARWRKAVALSVPPVAVMASMFSGYRQLKSSWYMWLFQLPMAESVLTTTQGEFISELWREWSPGYEAHAEDELVKTALASPKNLSAALGYYRAMFSPPPVVEDLQPYRDAQFSRGTVPVLYLHGVDDGCVGLPSSSAVVNALAPGSQMNAVRDAGHFVHLEQPERVANLVTEWLST